MPSSKIQPAIFLMVFAPVLLTAHASLSEPAAAACKASPGSATPRGSHWYYRFGHDKQRCWYLGSAAARMNASEAATPASTPTTTAQRATATEAAVAAPSQAAPTPAAQIAPAQVVFFDPSLSQQAKRLDFAARWPENLRSAPDLDHAEPATASDSYADGRVDSGTTAQMPSPWPVIDAAHAEDSSAAEAALRYFSLAGGLAIPLLLLAGWAARFRHVPQFQHVRERWQAIVGRLRPRRRADRAETADGVFASGPRRGDPTWRPLTPTNPARDVNTSLAELIRDLRRARGVYDSRQYAPRGGRTREGAYQQALEAAE
jgi:hypothetical protein